MEENKPIRLNGVELPPPPPGSRRSYHLDEGQVWRRITIVDEPIHAGNPDVPRAKERTGFGLAVLQIVLAVIRALGSWFSRR